MLAYQFKVDSSMMTMNFLNLKLQVSYSQNKQFVYTISPVNFI